MRAGPAAGVRLVVAVLGAAALLSAAAMPRVPARPGRAPEKPPLALRYFPLKPGAYWLYDEAGEAQAEDGRVYHHSNRYTVRVALVTRAAGVVVAKMMKYDRSGMTTFTYRASENRLTLEFDPSGPRGTHEIVHIAGTLPHSPASYVFPLVHGAHWAEAGAEREDHHYEYFVQRAETVVVPAGTFTACAHIIYRTLPDHHSVWFKAGVGPVRYHYAHHGTVLEVHGRLLQYRIPR